MRSAMLGCPSAPGALPACAAGQILKSQRPITQSAQRHHCTDFSEVRTRLGSGSAPGDRDAEFVASIYACISACISVALRSSASAGADAGTGAGAGAGAGAGGATAATAASARLPGAWSQNCIRLEGIEGKAKPEKAT